MLSQAEIRDRCERIIGECENEILENLRQFLFNAMNSQLKSYIEESINATVHVYVQNNIERIIQMAPIFDVKKELFNLKLEFDELYTPHNGTRNYGDNEICYFDEYTCGITINRSYVVEKILKEISYYV